MNAFNRFIQSFSVTSDLWYGKQQVQRMAGFERLTRFVDHCHCRRQSFTIVHSHIHAMHYPLWVHMDGDVTMTMKMSVISQIQNATNHSCIIKSIMLRYLIWGAFTKFWTVGARTRNSLDGRLWFVACTYSKTYGNNVFVLHRTKATRTRSWAACWTVHHLLS